MILPSFTYCGVLLLNLNNSQLRKLDSLDARARNIVNRDCSDTVQPPSIHRQNQKRACILVRKCLDGNSIDEMHNYFQINEHNYATRNSKKMLKLPLVKTQYASKSFYLMGAKLYNSLPLAARDSKAVTPFKNLLNYYFSN